MSRPYNSSMRALTLLETVGAMAILTVLIIVFMLGASYVRRQRDPLRCQNNLRVIGIAHIAYVDCLGSYRVLPWHSDGGVATLSILYTTFPFSWDKVDPNRKGAPLPGAKRVPFCSPDVFVCPSTNDPLCISASLDATTCSYIGRDPTWGPLTDAAESDTRLAADDGLDHHGGRCNVLFMDGHVEFVTASGDPTGPPLSATDE